MKKSLLTFIGILSLGMLASGNQIREFWNTDRSKSFKASLVSFDEKTKTVVVRTAKGKLINFSADNLSEDDQEYVAKEGEVLAIAKDVQIRLLKMEGKLDSSKSGGARTSKRDIEYEVILTNNGGELDGLEIRYSIFYNKGQEKGASVLDKHTGNIEVDALAAKRVRKYTTSALTLERMVKPPSTSGG